MPLNLDALFATLAIDPLADGVQIVACSAIVTVQPFAPLLPFMPARPLLVCDVAGDEALARVSATLASAYPPDHAVSATTGHSMTVVPLAALASLVPAPGLCLYLPALAALAAVRSFDTLQGITARLRAPGGCPWDREQTHESLKPYVLEETYEVLDALDTGDRPALCEELGDLLMQVMIHSQIASESDVFDIGDVLEGISTKMIRRHPHVFGDVQVRSAHDVLRNWQSIKQAEKPANSDGYPKSMLGRVPAQLPALAYAQAVQERTARMGFRPAQDVAASLPAAIAEVGAAGTEAGRLEAYGDLLFAVVQLGQLLDIEAEEALRMANRRFRARFEAVERLARQRGLDAGSLDSAQRDELWSAAADVGGPTE